MIYLDSSATTKPYKEVVDTIVNILENYWSNASSDNSFGFKARKIIDNVTNQVAIDINCKPENIIWTSGACESNSLAIYGLIKNYLYIDFYTTRLEHTSINKTHGVKLSNDEYGFINQFELQDVCRKSTMKNHTPFVSVCFANSEIGTVQDIKSISETIHKYNGYLHVDATQAYPWIKIDVQELGIDMMSVSGQKLHSVKGCGFLYVKDGIKLKPIIYGSQQEGVRGGTYPTHLIAAFGKALEITRAHNAYMYVKAIRDTLLKKLLQIPGVTLNGPSIDNNRLVNNISLSIDGVKADDLVALCDERDIIIAKGSACQSYTATPSSTLLAIGLTEEQALSTIRITLDELNTMEEINKAAQEIQEVIEILRKY